MMKQKIPEEADKNNEISPLEISDKQIELLARRFLPEIKKFFADEEVQQAFEDWKKEQEN